MPSVSRSSPVKDSNGNVISKIEEQLKRWKEHFQEVLNRPPPIITPDIEEGYQYRKYF
jgi:hypothetical protein